MAKKTKGASPTEIANFINGTTIEEYRELFAEAKAETAKQIELARSINNGTKAQLVNALEDLFKTSPELRDSPAVDALIASAMPQHKHTPLLDACIEADVPAYLYGETGSGKSTAAEQAATKRQMALRAISLSPMTSKSDIVGYMDANGVYHGTGFREVYEGGGIFLFDEIDNGNPSVIAQVNRGLANFENEFPDGLVQRNWNTRIIAAANTIGKGANAQYVGRNALDAAFLDRFAMIPWDIDENLEDRLMKVNEHKKDESIDISKGGIPTPKEWLDEVRGYRSRAEKNKLRVVISQRPSIYGRKLAETGVGAYWLSKMLIFKGMSEYDQSKIS